MQGQRRARFARYIFRRELSLQQNVKLEHNDVPGIKRRHRVRKWEEKGSGWGEAAVNVCGVRKSKKSRPNDSCKSSAHERKSLLCGKKMCRAMR